MFVFGVIPARGGSKGLPDKNIRSLGDIPMIGWSIRAAKESKTLDRTVVSTEDPRITAESRKLGGDVPFARPVELAADDSSIIDVLKHAVRWLEAAEKRQPDLIVLLQPTSPLRTAQDIDETVRLVQDTDADSAQTVAVDHSHPHHRFTMEGGKLKPLLIDPEKYSQRQDAPMVYRPTGAVFVVRYRVLMDEGKVRGKDHRGLVRDFESSVDVDSIWDFRLAEMVFQERLAGKRA